MIKTKNIKNLSYLVCILVFISAGVGLFYKNGGQSIIVKNIFNESVKLYGDGIYAYDSFSKGAINKGTDLAMLLIIPIFLIITVNYNKSKKTRFIHAGLLSGIVYYSFCISFGVIYNALFPIYLLLFSSSFFLMIMSLKNIIEEDNIPSNLKTKTLKGTSIFLFIEGCSVLIWLSIIIPALLSGTPIETIDIYTTEPTFLIDLGILLPTSIFAGWMLMNRKPIGYKLTPILLMLIVVVGVMVVSQTIMQLNHGIVLPAGQLVGMVLSFVILATVAIILNFKFFKQL